MKIINRLLDSHRLPLVYVDANGNVTISRSIKKKRLHEIRGIMLGNDIEVAIVARPCMNYEAATKHAILHNGKLFSLAYKQVYEEKREAFNKLVFSLIKAGKKEAIPLTHCDPVWCQEQSDDEEMGCCLEFVGNNLYEKKYFKYALIWCRLQYKH